MRLTSTQPIPRNVIKDVLDTATRNFIITLPSNKNKQTNENTYIDKHEDKEKKDNNCIVMLLLQAQDLNTTKYFIHTIQSIDYMSCIYIYYDDSDSSIPSLYNFLNVKYIKFRDVNFEHLGDLIGYKISFVTSFQSDDSTILLSAAELQIIVLLDIWLLSDVFPSQLIYIDTSKFSSSHTCRKIKTSLIFDRLKRYFYLLTL